MTKTKTNKESKLMEPIGESFEDVMEKIIKPAKYFIDNSENEKTEEATNEQ